MALKDELAQEVFSTLDTLWATEDAMVVPDATALRLNANHAKHLDEATVLYADLDGSTNMVDTLPWWYSAEIYKSYLRCAAAIIKSEGGIITAYDGDRVMAVFAGDSKNTSAVRTALKINFAVEQIIRPVIRANRYGHNDFLLKHVVGVDTSRLHAARIGVRGDNDVVWVGRAANHAAKLTNISEKPIWITGDVFDNMHQSVKFTNGMSMWEERRWTPMNDARIYSSTWIWPFE